MSRHDVSEKRYYRSVFISDIHLCTRDSQADLLFGFLDSIRFDNLYLVGDVIDVWALRRQWHWPSDYNEILRKLLKRSHKGARVVYIPGNHDEFFRAFEDLWFGDVEIRREAVHETADGRRFAVFHGDEYDFVVLNHKWLSLLGSWAYDHLIRANRVYNALRRVLGLPYWSLSGAIKRRVQQAVNYITSFESIVRNEALKRGLDGVICGHIHQPRLSDENGFLYGNTGDWVENCTALVEDEFGKFDILWWHSEIDERCSAMRFEVELDSRGAGSISAVASAR